MLTVQQRDAQRDLLDSGMVSIERLRALKHGLLARRDDARAAAKAEGLDERFAASLRGKAIAYQEAANLVQQLLYGAPMRPARWSTARKKARAYRDRCNARRIVASGHPDAERQRFADAVRSDLLSECTPSECSRPAGDCCLDPLPTPTTGSS